MRRAPLCGLLAGGIAAWFVACTSLSGLSGAGAGDADAADVGASVDDGALDATSDTLDAAVDHFGQPDSGFLLAVSPAHITEDPGDSFPVTITLNRADSFSDAVTIAVNGLPTGAAATPLVIPGGASTGDFSLSIAAGATVTNADIPLTVVASNGTGAFSQTVPLVLGFGSLLRVSDGGLYVVPMSAKTLIVKAWGAGGGGGGINGAPGGGGGFASASLSVVPGESLIPEVGTGGTDNGAGAGGGGLTGLRRGSTYLLIAGGGGGGGWNFNFPPQAPDRNGGGGGGLSGQDSPDPVGGGGRGGTQTAGGSGGGPDAGAGSSLQGGNAPNPNQPGGTPGGGFGGYNGSCSVGGGGGGAGYFGGGAGAESCSFQGTGGGGGGSGYLQPSATKGVLTGAVDFNCANRSDPDYVSGVGTGGPAGPESKPNGGAGLIVIRLPKP